MKVNKHPGWSPGILRRFREAHGLTQDGLAERLRGMPEESGLRPPAATAEMVRRHEQGRVFPGVSYRRFYCVMFGVTEPELGFRPPLPGELVALARVIGPTGGVCPPAVAPELPADAAHRTGHASPAQPARRAQRSGLVESPADRPGSPAGRPGGSGVAPPGGAPRAVASRMPGRGPLPGAAAWTRRSSEVLAASLVGATPGWDAVRLAHEWLLVEPPQIAQLASGRHVGAALAERVEGRVRQLRRLDDHVGGHDLVGIVERELAATAEMVQEASYNEAVGRRLLSALAQLCQLAGRVAADAGRYAAAARYLTGGIRAAHAGGGVALGAELISTHAYQLASDGDVRQGVLLAQTACAGAGSAVPAATQALLADRLAWAHARAGDRQACERALVCAERLFARADPAAGAGEVYWLDSREIDVMAGRCWTELARPAPAEERLRLGLTGYDPLRPREIALYETWLAEVHLLRGDVEQACARATRIARLDAVVNSARTAGRLQTLAQRLAGYRSVPAARDFAELYRALRAATPDPSRPASPAASTPVGSPPVRRRTERGRPSPAPVRRPSAPVPPPAQPSAAEPARIVPAVR